MRVLSSVMVLTAVVAGPVRAQQPLTDVRVVEATWIRDVAITRWENDRPVIYINPKLLERFGPVLRDFFIGHEFGHVALAHDGGGALQTQQMDSTLMIMRQRQELEADCYAASRLAVEHRDAVEAAIRLFTRMGAFRFDRLHPSGSQRAASLLACLAAATDSNHRGPVASGIVRSAKARGAAIVELAPATAKRFMGHVRVIIDGRSMGTISTIQHLPSLVLDDLSDGPHRYEIRMEVFTLDDLLEPNPSGLVEGRGTIDVRRGTRLEVHWLGEEPPSLLPAGTAAVAGS
jgi:hypothetical protein